MKLCRQCRQPIDRRTLKAGGEVCFGCATTTKRPTTFKQLDRGDRFHFTNDERDEARILPDIRIVYRTKVSDWHYENTHADGDTSEGRVGVGDNPVIKAAKE